MNPQDMKLEDEDDGMEKVFRFHKLIKQGASCRTCGYAMPFKESIICGVHHIGFTYDSLCDDYKTEAERKAELEVRRQEMLANPNSFLSKLKNQQDEQ